MRDNIEVFLSENPSASFKPGEIARKLNQPKVDVKRKLKKLVKQGKVRLTKGRYKTLGKQPVRKKEDPKETPVHAPVSNAPSRLEVLAQTVGISIESLQRWVEDQRRKTSDEETNKLLFGVLQNLEAPKGEGAER